MTVVTGQQLTGVLVDPLEPGSAEWMQRMSASKVAAVLGLSPYESPFSLHHRMTGAVPPQVQTAEMSRGHYLEPAVRTWFADQHPEWTVTVPAGTWQHGKRAWQIASPDALVAYPDGSLAGYEGKTAAAQEQWGKPGTDEIPVYYRAQVMWQMDTIGYRRTHVAVLDNYLELKEYVLDYDQTEADLIRYECERFLDDVNARHSPPIDGHSETYVAVRNLHPHISPEDVELPLDVARDYCHAKHAVTAAKIREQFMTSTVTALLGDAKRARFDGKTIAQRQAKGDGVPYLVAGRSLPTFDTSDTTETSTP